MPDRRPEALDSRAHVGRGRGRERDAEEQARGVLVRLGAEPGPAAREHALVDARVEQVLLDVEDALLPRREVRVLCVVDLEPELNRWVSLCVSFFPMCVCVCVYVFILYCTKNM